MPTTIYPSTKSLVGRRLYATLTPVPTVCFLGAWLTDLAYVKTLDLQWANFSVWLLTAGLVVAFVAVLAGIFYYAVSPWLRPLATTKLYIVGNAVVLVLSILNAFVHSRDGYTSVVPTGITLSTIVVVLLVVTTAIGMTFGSRRVEVK